MTKATVALSPSRLPGLDLALNPYSGCAHRCTYCYAPYIMRRPVDDWGCTISARMNLPVLLDKELPRKKGMIGLGTVTDPYQPAEGALRLTRHCLEIMAKHHARTSVLTKSSLVARDADLLSRLDGSEVGITMTTVRDDRAAIFEPCASPPSKRLEAMKALHEAGVNVYAFLGPIIPTVADRGLVDLIGSICDAGASMIMVDRLNLRPGMMARMLARMEEVDPSSIAELGASIEDDAYYGSITERIKALCREQGMPYRDAF
ncbi:hypothetical protein AOA80_09355 [Methanomassiliicoccales archaeon RumEn M1]|nr:hypothetical protein AOA80_09355 [Methanomassiliicoccales archaeon RumEn M1]